MLLQATVQFRLPLNSELFLDSTLQAASVLGLVTPTSSSCDGTAHLLGCWKTDVSSAGSRYTNCQLMQRHSWSPRQLGIVTTSCRQHSRRLLVATAAVESFSTRTAPSTQQHIQCEWLCAIASLPCRITQSPNTLVLHAQEH